MWCAFTEVEGAFQCAGRTGKIKQMTPLWHAWARMADRFSQETALLCGGVGRQWTALVMDSKLLHVSTMLSSGAAEVLAIVPSPVEAGLAYEVLTQSRSAVAASASDSSSVRV